MRQEWASECQLVGREKWQNVNELIIKLKWDASRLTTSAMEKYPNPKGINLIEPSPSKKLFSAAKKKLFSNYEISDSVMMSPSSTMFRFLLNGTSQPWICQSVTFSFSLVLPFFFFPPSTRLRAQNGHCGPDDESLPGRNAAFSVVNFSFISNYTAWNKSLKLYPLAKHQRLPPSNSRSWSCKYIQHYVYI